MLFETLDEVRVDPGTARVYEEGWQSASPTSWYPVDAPPPRPAADWRRRGNYRPESAAPADGFQGEGLLAIDPGDGGPLRLYAAPDPLTVPSIRATLTGDRLVVAADGPVTAHTGVPLGDWASGFARTAGGPLPRAAPTAWCSWYHYFERVTETDIDENVAAIRDRELPVEVVQVDGGWQAAVGDWLHLSDRFTSLDGVAARIRDAGLRAGIWVAPFWVQEGSWLAREHQEWLIAGPDGLPVSAGRHWGAPSYGLDTTNPAAADYVCEVFAWLAGLGFDYFKIDFAYAAALAGSRHTGVEPLAAYRRAVTLVREVIGPDAYLLGCGAPILPSVGLYDAMRVSADISPAYEPVDGDLSQPSQRGAALSTQARAWQHGRFWVNDPDCLIARPEVERRADWARVVERFGGLRVSSDRIADLDDWGVETTRRLLANTPPPTPFA
ncbi:glycoside hydrolase family 36 protein [Phytohabitans flavus]|uniref:Alpha-galactosidase n=1 Tax=Phytohabitans flavus TaxID=1076124 RepID=A0A6F8Y5W6_9ACTN|nr:glycoside hydrolase family 36 protein [Phytohabitans flavus]BCB81506.1 alpha-galactosidase [Phytohabitans flavus]